VRNVKKALKKALDTLSRVPSDAARKRVQRLQRKLAKRLRKTNPCSKKNNACLNGSACKIGKSGKAKCMCKNGFNGRLCQKNVDECANKPCGNVPSASTASPRSSASALLASAAPPA